MRPHPRASIARFISRSIEPSGGDRDARSGAAAVEMAIILPLLLGLTFGIIDLAWIYSVRQAMTFAAREGVRELALQGASLTEAINVTNTYLTAAGITNATVTGQNAFAGNGNSAAARQVYIQVQVPAGSAILADPFGVFSSLGPLVVKVTMRKEGQLLPPGGG